MWAHRQSSSPIINVIKVSSLTWFDKDISDQLFIIILDLKAIVQTLQYGLDRICSLFFLLRIRWEGNTAVQYEAGTIVNL